MSEPSTETVITPKALSFAAEHFGVPTNELKVSEVSGGYSLNRRAIVTSGDEHVFVKEVDTSLLEGDGTRERNWLAKDHGITEHLRGEGMHMVSEWSKLSDDSEVLLLPALLPQDGWLWDLPEDPERQRKYIDAVVRIATELEGAQFTEAEAERLTLKPYFRKEIAADAATGLSPSADDLNKLKIRYQQLREQGTTEFREKVITEIEQLMGDEATLAQLRASAERLMDQPDEAFGHCDIRIDNLAYHAETDKVVLVDWNWASGTPSKFGTTEFLISVAVKGVDISEWHDQLNPELLAGLLGFWWRRCIQPNLGNTNKLRVAQAMSAAVAFDLFKKVA